MAEKQAKKELAKNKKKKNMLSAVATVVSRFGVRIILYSLVAILFYYGITKAYAFGYRMFTTKAVSVEPGTDVLVNIAKDMTTEEIGELLESKGLVRDASVFVVQAALYTSEKYPIYPGTYTLNTSQTPKEMIAVMSVEPETEEETTALALGLEPDTQAESQEDGTQSGESDGQ